MCGCETWSVTPREEHRLMVFEEDNILRKIIVPTREGKNKRRLEKTDFANEQLYDFFLNNQTHALIILVLFCYKTQHVSDIFSAHHQEFYTVHSALVSFIHEANKAPPSRALHQKIAIVRRWCIIGLVHETYQCRMQRRKLLMMGREDARNM